MARHPDYYTDFSIQDKVLGRFEVLALHLFLMLRRLKEDTSPLSGDISQEICDLFVADMDHSLRNARLSESKIDKNFKRFIEGFYGRLVAYDKGLDEGALDAAILKNVYGDDQTYLQPGKQMAVRMTNLLDVLRQQPDVNNLNFKGEK
ncbi:ubiquinol-cytochrome C chaperone family protein [Candidatus Odyssella acanthamoebae]|uniref:ubiquinol-cytochrome C chaperone family protein n=1 Tax=Candidatus Odyssella acanthamoebae TaxID=91604 RepID=UPI0018DD40FD|nr:ubiquinol-cytochrome C chaperone family protein [Candidatus Paracaedibacter acanthamoebae]